MRDSKPIDLLKKISGIIQSHNVSIGREELEMLEDFFVLNTVLSFLCRPDDFAIKEFERIKAKYEVNNVLFS